MAAWLPDDELVSLVPSPAASPSPPQPGPDIPAGAVVLEGDLCVQGAASALRAPAQGASHTLLPVAPSLPAPAPLPASPRHSVVAVRGARRPGGPELARVDWPGVLVYAVDPVVAATLHRFVLLHFNDDEDAWVFVAGCVRACVRARVRARVLPPRGSSTRAGQ